MSLAYKYMQDDHDSLFIRKIEIKNYTEIPSHFNGKPSIKKSNSTTIVEVGA